MATQRGDAATGMATQRRAEEAAAQRDVDAARCSLQQSSAKAATALRIAAISTCYSIFWVSTRIVATSRGRIATSLTHHHFSAHISTPCAYRAIPAQPGFSLGVNAGRACIQRAPRWCWRDELGRVQKRTQLFMNHVA
ncbi:hypothetical protein FA95DRAFT_246497 [Auriscalpium vulgare]|uniref:Uncharacterized protein n=1 Tax=Auriscalpium vulgare TaxID=40419 RepID=A0ACB8RKV4_9AGAM|nr:hypothetical protein FA95DRAFT_246497 [Auriscalpium vulgare]